MRNQPVITRLAFWLCFISILLPAQRVWAQSPGPSAQVKPPALQLAGLHQSVTIRRDERGIPYLEAANEEDLYFAQGYVAARDRLWQMDLLRRTARGELSTLFGRATLEEDKRHRTFGFAALVEQRCASLPPARRPRPSSTMSP